MNILLIGPQGSGKGTQARILCDKFNFFYFESGAYLRKIAKTEKWLDDWLKTGKLVPDKEMTSYLTAFLDSKNLYDDIIFDGFPRTLVQYNFWKEWIKDKEVKLDLVVVLHIDKKESVRRLSARRQDPTTGKIYNLISDPPPPSVDRSKLIERNDEKPEVIEKRLAEYHENTEPLIEQLKKETKVVVVDGERPIDVIAADLEKIVRDSL